MSGEVLVKVEGVKKKFCRRLRTSLWYGLKDLTAEVFGGSPDHDRLRPEEFWAVNDVSFELRRGECLGLIGRNGAGKTTLLKMLNGLIKPDHGRIEMRGRVGALIALGAGFNPILTGRENIYVNGSVLGLTTREINEKIDEIIDFADLREFIDSPVQSYSSGMQVRLGFSVATSLEPDILLLDEVLAVGDRQFRSKCMSRVARILDRAAVIFVSHGEGHIQQLCDAVLWLNEGRCAYQGATEEGLRAYLASMRCGADAFVNCHPPVQSAKISVKQHKLQRNEELQATLTVESTDAVIVDYFVGTIVAETGESVAQFTLPQNLLQFQSGVNRIDLAVPRLQLAPGVYRINILCCANRGKKPLIHVILGAAFEAIGGVQLWTSYQPEAFIAECTAISGNNYAT